MELREKQDFLFREILQANQDPELFQEFLESEKGVNLEEYSMEELVDVVRRFKGNPLEVVVEEKTQLSEMPLKKQKKEDESAQLSHIQSQKSSISREPAFNTSTKVLHQLLKKTSLPKLYERVHLSKQNIRVKIRSYSKQEQQSFLKSTYAAFLLQTSVGWAVKRRFSDFQWLHAKLYILYPGLPIPPIAKKTTMRNFQDRHLQERMVVFESFMNRLLSIPQICSDVILQDFLSVAGKQQFQRVKQKNNLRVSNNTNKIISLKGENVINKSQFAVTNDELKYNQKTNELIKSVNLQLQAFQKALKSSAQRAFELSSTFHELYSHVESKARCGHVIELMNQFMSELGYRLDGQYFFVKNNLQNYWHYEQKYEQNLVSFIGKINKEQNQIVQKSKNNLANEMDVDQAYSKSKVMSQYLSSKELYRIKLSFLLQELERHKHEDYYILSKNWAESIQTYVGGAKDLMLSGADQLTKAMCVAEGKKLIQVQYLSPNKQPLRQQNHKMPSK